MDENDDFIQFVASIRSRKDSELELIKQTIENARRRSPELADAIRYCAIPRRFDAEIIGALRDAPRDRDGNKRILDQVIEHSFVLPRAPDGFVYHDNVRDVLIKDWRTLA